MDNIFRPKVVVRAIPPGKEITLECFDKAQLQNIKSITDGSIMRGRNMVKAHGLSITKMGPLSKFMDIIYADEYTESLREAVKTSIRKRVEALRVCKQEYFEEVPFDYDYRGAFPSVMKHQKVLFNCIMRTNKCGILAEPGTCKTGPYLWAIDKKIQTGVIKKALIITLSSLRENVVEEMGMQIPGRTGVILDGKEHTDKVIWKKYKKASFNKDYDIYIMSYESARTCLPIIPKDYFDLVICDEAHRIGDPSTQQTGAIMEHFDYTRYRYVISGTINANNYMSAFMPIRFMGQDTVPIANFHGFRDEYMYSQDPMGRTWRPKPALPATMAAILERVCIFFAKSECMNLPPIVYSQVYSEMSSAQTTMYTQLETELFTTLEDIDQAREERNGEIVRPSMDLSDGYEFRVANSLVLIGKLHQIASGFLMDKQVRLGEDGDVLDEDDEVEIKRTFFFRDNPKLDSMVSWIKHTLPPNKKLIIWATHTCAVEMIYNRLLEEKLGNAIKVFKQVNAYEAGKRFENEDIRFFIANKRKAGVGLNLQFSHYQAYYMNSFSFIAREQCEGRQHRGKQAESVNCIDFVVKGSVDKKILKALRDKKNISDTLNEFCKPK